MAQEIAKEFTCFSDFSRDNESDYWAGVHSHSAPMKTLN